MSAMTSEEYQKRHDANCRRRLRQRATLDRTIERREAQIEREFRTRELTLEADMVARSKTEEAT